MKAQIRKIITNVLTTQGQSLLESKKYIGPEFVRAVTSILKCKGKIILTGVGKSGLIAQKIASTFSSTGTAAIYLHPVEGMHGNLGVLRKNDLVFAIGKSGESEELINILPSIKKIGAKLICLTGNANSSLARYSDISLCVPIHREACPLNLAPTTSSTVSLVIGDSIAIALMKLRGFDKNKFALLHPGGLLGKRLLLKVSDVMRSGKRNPVVKVSDTMVHLVVEISKKWTGAASVVDHKGRMVGLVTDFDIRRAFLRGKTPNTLSIKEIMNSRPTFIFEDEMAVKALELMESRTKPLTVLPVVSRSRKSVGMIHLHDLISKGLVSGPLDRF